MGDPVTSIGGCLVTSIKDWNSCLAQSIREQSYGNCVPVSMIDELDTARKKKLGTVLPSKTDSDVMFCLHYQGLINNRSAVY